MLCSGSEAFFTGGLQNRQQSAFSGVLCPFGDHSPDSHPWDNEEVTVPKTSDLPMCFGLVLVTPLKKKNRAFSSSL